MPFVSHRVPQVSSLSATESRASSRENSFFSALEGFLAPLSDRPRSILSARFGLESKQPQTLEAIGKSYGITRERVRQIIRSAVKDIRTGQSATVLDEFCHRIVSTIESHSGILAQEDLYAILAEGDVREAGAVRFFVENFAQLDFLREDARRKDALVTTSFRKESWKLVVDAAEKVFQNQTDALPEGELFALVRRTVSGISQSTMVDYLRASKLVQSNVFGLWGLASWPDITPKGTRAKVYLILKSMKKPLHFREIAKLIDKHHLQKRGRKTHYQTVHNELIKDKRFVLVGRGVYALENWGYERGTIREVIAKILKQANQPLSRDEVFDRLIALREAKRSTVVINLNLYFRKVGKNAYTLKSE